MRTPSRRTILIVAVVVLVALWAAAYLHTTPGAPYACWPDQFPPMPRWLQYWYEVYCHA